MLIDWFTVVAQALNFLILVWLMKRFLYKPILSAIDAREARIAAELADADTRKSEAKAEQETFQQKNAAFDADQATRMSTATDEVAAERTRLLDEARAAADALHEKRRVALMTDAKNLNDSIARRAQDEVFVIARKTLADLASKDLEGAAVAEFVRRLRALEGPANEALATALKTAAKPIVVRSAFDLPAEPRAAIQTALNETFSADFPLAFETTPDLISGIELTASGQKVAWSIKDYLKSLQLAVSTLVQDAGRPADDTAATATTAETPAS